MLDAAVELFAEKGMGITVQSLADRVQVTQPLVHRYFP
ncbi:helix-turn-helix domain-containing protein, partial [Rhizobiaceae sp. 2RAB30]